MAVDWRERLRAMAGATLGILVTAFLSHRLAGTTTPWLVAPLGASAVLVFAAPASPLAQPWSVVGGNTLSALVGVLCVNLIDVPELAACAAVGLAIGLMMLTRCLHPPGGAAALLVALAGVKNPGFALFPVLTNSLLLVAMGVAWNNATKRAYPHQQLPAPTKAIKTDREGLDADLEAVIARYNQVLDVSRDDLKALVEDTHLRTYERRLANTRCADVMSKQVITVTLQTPRDAALDLFTRHHVKALPVIDDAHAVLGIVTPADFIRRPAAQTVGELMTQHVRLATTEQHLSELVPLFATSGHHHLPVVDAAQRLAGIITQSDVVGALLTSATRASASETR
jgi:CBS domain-containing membrane protein